MKNLKLDTVDKLGSFLQRIVEQSVDIAKASNSLEEKEKQQQLEADLFGDDDEDGDKKDTSQPQTKNVKKASPAPAPGDDTTDTSADKGNETNGDEKKDKFQKTFFSHDMPAAKDITVDMVVSRLNSIRSGRSFNNEDISVELKHYFDDLEAPERVALLSFLTGISEITNAGITGEKAPEPSDEKIKISGGEKEKQPVQPNSNPPAAPMASPPPQQRRSRGLENTAAPIVVGSRQTTEDIRRKIRTIL